MAHYLSIVNLDRLVGASDAVTEKYLVFPRYFGHEPVSTEERRKYK